MPAVSVADPVSTADATAIRAVIDRQIDAWNRHDMEAFVADTTPDVDWINIVGVHWRGPRYVSSGHGCAAQGHFCS
jgi:uncharacterized protein (TIGR02246 family)